MIVGCLQAQITRAILLGPNASATRRSESSLTASSRVSRETMRKAGNDRAQTRISSRRSAGISSGLRNEPEL